MVYSKLKKILFLLTIITLSFVESCSIKKPELLLGKNNKTESKKEIFPNGEINSSNITISKEKSESNSGSYLPKLYISKLLKTKSHVKACEVIKKIKQQEPNAIVIKKSEVLKLYNFHEGVTEEIIETKKKLLITKNGKNFEIELVNNDEIKLDGIEYIKISNTYDDHQTEISNFITRSIIDPKVYKNKTNTFIVNEKGEIYYKDEKYTYGLELVFTSEKYDFIHTDKYKTLNIEITPNSIRLYEIVIKEGFEEEPYTDKNAKYKLIDVFKK